MLHLFQPIGSGGWVSGLQVLLLELAGCVGQEGLLVMCHHRSRVAFLNATLQILVQCNVLLPFTFPLVSKTHRVRSLPDQGLNLLHLFLLLGELGCLDALHV